MAFTFIRFIKNYIRFVTRLFKWIVSQNMDPRYYLIFLNNIEGIVRNIILKEGEIIKTTEDSKKIYNDYTDREIYEEKKIEQFNYKGKIVKMTVEERRLHQLNYLFKYIDELLLKQDKVSILEIGCGNCINAYHVKEKYKEQVDYYGVDIAKQRIEIGLEHFSSLQPENYKECSITERTEFADNQFDIVFSMHCLEQIAYETKYALREMYRICKHMMVMVEPVYENGNFVQRAYLVSSDHTKILLRSAKELHLPIVHNESCDLQTSLSNQSSLIVIEKKQ